MKLFGIIFTLFPMIFLSVGITQAWKQHDKIVSYVSVEATVLSKKVERHESRDSDGHTSVSYKPIVNYSYQVNKKKYTCNDVLPLSISSGRSWANSIIKKFTVKKKTEAFYNPLNPSKAFLIKQYVFFPYIFILFPMLFVTIGLSILIASGASKTKPPLPLARSEGWFEIKPAARIIDKARAAWLAAGLWNGVGLLASGHYFVMASPPYQTIAYVFTGIYGGIGIIPISLAIYYIILRKNISDASVFINSNQVLRGQEFTTAVHQQVRTRLMVEELKIGLVCDRTTKTRSGSKTSISTSKCYEEYAVIMKNQNLQNGQKIEASASISVPANESPSSPSGSKGYPRHVWKIAVRSKLANSPDYKADFPITVT